MEQDENIQQEPEATEANKEQTIPEQPISVIQHEIEYILDGIDREETDNDGWWETSTGAEFGRKKLDEIRELINKRKL